MFFETKKAEKRFESDIRASITRNCSLAITHTKNSPEEPDLVAHLIDGMPSDIYNSLSAYCPEMKFSVSGVFCHQKPYVKSIDFNEACELGDLLIVYIEEQSDTCIKCNSILLQAKTTATKQHPLYNKGDLIQFRLYSSWPTFEYAKAGSLNGIKRDIIPKTITFGAQYLLMQKNYDDEGLINIAVPNRNLSPNLKFSESIVGLITFRTGRTFEYTHPSNDDWTNMIWDLLGNAKSAIFNRKKAGKINEPRLTTAGEFFSPQLNFSVPDDIPHQTDEIDDLSFLPSIIIQGKSSQESYQNDLFFE